MRPNERQTESDVEELAALSIHVKPTGKHCEGFQLLYPAFIKWHSTRAGVLKKQVQVQTKQNKKENK